MRLWAILAAAAVAAAFRIDGPLLHGRADGDRVHVGFRYMSTGEVEAIKKNNFRGVVSLGTQGRQLGPATYATPGLQQYGDKTDSLDDGWDCIVMMDADRWNGLKKVWVPKLFNFEEEGKECKLDNLWTMIRERIDNRNKFLERLEGGPYTEENTLLFSFILGKKGVQQVAIPNSVVKENVVIIEKCAQRSSPEHQFLNTMKPSTVNWNVQSMKGWGLGVNE